MRTYTGIDSSFYVRWNNSCIWRPADEGLFVLQILRKMTEKDFLGRHLIRHVTLNREGKDTWMLCTGENTIQDIIDMLQEEYEGEKEEIQKDVMEFIQDLLDEEYVLLEKSPHPVKRNLDKNASPLRIDDAIANVVENNFIIMNMKTSEVQSFDKDVENLWNICDGTRTIGDILSAAANREEAAFLLDFMLRLDFLKLKTNPEDEK